MSAAFLVVALLLGPGTVRLGLSAHTLLPSLLLAVGGVLMTLDVGGPPVAIVFGTVLVAATVVGASTRIVVTVRPAAS
jgi:hypothetical protein